MVKQAKQQDQQSPDSGEAPANLHAQPPKITALEAFRRRVLPPEKATDLWRSLPGHIKPVVFERNLLNALMQNPDLLKMAPELIYREVSKAAGLGLLLDPLLGEAYIIRVWDGRSNGYVPQLRIGYRGMCKLSRQTGDVTNIYAREVRAKDTFIVRQGANEDVVHEFEATGIFGDRGDITGYYAIIKFHDGTWDFEPMSVADCRRIRDRSDGWKAYKGDKIKSTPWLTDEEEMSKKTVLRRLLKRQPQSPEVAEAMRIEDEAEFPDMRNVTPPQPTASPVRERLRGQIGNGDGMTHEAGNDVREAIREARGNVVDVENNNHTAPEGNASGAADGAAPSPPHPDAAPSDAGGFPSPSPASTHTDAPSQGLVSAATAQGSAAAVAGPTDQPDNQTSKGGAAQDQSSGTNTVAEQNSIDDASGTGQPNASSPRQKSNPPHDAADSAAPNGNGNLPRSPAPGAADPTVTAAHARGRNDRDKGMKKRAVPPEWRDKTHTKEATAWMNGWQERDDELRGRS